MKEAEEGSVFIGHLERAPARVLGCLMPGFVSISLLDEQGDPYPGLPVRLPVGSVPPDLRMPNSEFDVLFDPSRYVWAYTQVVRTGETEPYQPAA